MTVRVLDMLRLVSLLIFTSFTLGKRCEIKQCTFCTVDFADCTTYDPNNPIPSALDAKTKELYVYYYGPNIDLVKDKVNHLKALTKIHLSGNFRTIKDDTFTDFPFLTNITIYNSSLARIEDYAFGSNSSLLNLNLSTSNLKYVPKNVFHSLPNVVTLDLSFSSHMTVCSPEIPSIGDEFRHMVALRELRLDNLGTYNRSCRYISENYFKPIEQVTELHLSGSGFLEGKPTVLKSLENLETLVINDVNPYRKCPNMAKDLFSNLSDTLHALFARNWKTDLAMNYTCAIHEDTLSGLKTLPNLTYLDFRYSDKIFGDSIDKSLFQGFMKLQYLDIGWCRFNNIETGAFASLNLSTLKLNSNQLGSREFWPYGVDSVNLTSPVEYLTMSQCGIAALDYYAYFVARTFPNLKALDLSHNYLYYLPRFTKGGHITPVSHIKILNLERNVITSLTGHYIADICDLMQELEHLYAYSNRIEIISDMCTSLTLLNLDDNLLYKNMNQNFEAIALLRNIEILHIGRNKIDHIPGDLFKNMRYLRFVYLSDNQLNHLDQHLFDTNTHLEELHLDINKMALFNVSLIEPADGLQLLDISDNQISQFSDTFIHFMKDRGEGKLHTVMLGDNPFDCSCGHTNFRDWLKNTPLVHSQVGLRCASPADYESEHVYDYTEEYFTCSVEKPLIITALVVVSVLLTVLIAVPCHKYRWYIRHVRVVYRAVKDRATDIKHADECTYDAMICCNQASPADFGFAKMLLEKLEEGDYPALTEQIDDRRSKVYLAARDTLPGSYRFETLCEVMRQSRKIIIVMSNSFLNSSECMAEAAFAGEELFGSKVYKPDKILVLVLDDLNEDLLLSSTISGLLTETVIDLVGDLHNV